MKKIIAVFSLTMLIGISQAQIKNPLNKLKKIKADSAVQVITSEVKDISQTKSKSLSGDEVINGLKEALTIGTKNSAKKLGSVDGYFKDAALKILMPDEAQKAVTTLRKYGMGSLVDKAILSMNRAAEDAASGVGEIFIEAVKNMTIADGMKILRGADNAATDYLKTNTTQQLTEKMRPVIEASLNKVDATKYWKEVFTNYNRLSPTNKINPDLTAYVTSKAMDGIFISIAQEELKIRKDPVARVTETLQKVFGE